MKCYGKNPQVLKDIVNAAVEHSVEKDLSKTNIYEMNRWGLGWEKIHQKEPRKLESVILDADLSKMVIEDIQKF